MTLMLAITAFCTMILAFLVYHYAAEALKREITNAYHVSLLHTRDRVETYLRHLDQATLQFEKISEVERFIAQDNREGIDRLTMITIMQRIHTSVEYVDNVVVFDARSGDLHVTNTAMNPVYSDYKPVIAAFSAMDEKRAFLNMTVNGIPTTVYARSMPAFGPRQPVYILYHINQHIFDDFLGESRYSDTGSYFVIDGAGKLIASRGPATGDALSAWIARINADKRQVPETKIGSFAADDSFITYLPQSFDGWVYAFSISNNAFLHQIGKIRNVILILSIGLFAASILIAVVSSHWLWRGWSRVRMLLDDQQVDDADGNEFDRLLSKVRNVVEQSNQLKQQMNEIMPTVKDTFVLSLLENGVRTADDWNKVSRYGVALLPGAYGCFCLEMDADWEQDQYSERDILTFEYAVISVMREVIEQMGTGFAVRTDNALLAAVVSADGEAAEKMQHTMLQMTGAIHQFIDQHFPIRVSIGVSRVRSNFSHLNISYREARELLCNKLISGGNRVFTLEQAAGDPAPDPFPIREVENDIVYGIRTRNREYAYNSAEQLYRLKDMPNVHYKWLQSKLVETAHSIFRQVRKSYDVPVAEREPTLGELLALSTLDDWVDWFRRACIDPLVDQLNARHRSQSEQAIRLIREFIGQHLETDLKLEACCKSLQIPVSFAKQALKETLDTTFIELVLRERIEQAKDWLLAGSMNVDEIARRLQYSNAQNFSRTFKKLVGMPPGQYRSGNDYLREKRS